MKRIEATRQFLNLQNTDAGIWGIIAREYYRLDKNAPVPTPESVLLSLGIPKKLINKAKRVTNGK